LAVQFGSGSVKVAKLHEVSPSDPRWLPFKGYFKVFVQKIALVWML
jgi:hypothetical protein